MVTAEAGVCWETEEMEAVAVVRVDMVGGGLFNESGEFEAPRCCLRRLTPVSTLCSRG